MTAKVMRAVATQEDSFTEFAQGTLSPAKHIMLACQSEIAPQVAEDLAFREELASGFLTVQDGRSRALSPEFIGRVLAALPQHQTGAGNSNDNVDADNFLAPPSLRNILGHGLRELRWRSLVPGVAVHDVIGDKNFEDGDRLYLMRVKAGMKMPDHTHDGDEWTLLLSGAYTAEGQHYSRGDLHVTHGDDGHAPQIEADEDCICLVMTQAPVKLNSIIARLIQPLVGI